MLKVHAFFLLFVCFISCSKVLIEFFNDNESFLEIENELFDLIFEKTEGLSSKTLPLGTKIKLDSQKETFFTFLHLLFCDECKDKSIKELNGKIFTLQATRSFCNPATQYFNQLKTPNAIEIESALNWWINPNRKAYIFYPLNLLQIGFIQTTSFSAYGADHKNGHFSFLSAFVPQPKKYPFKFIHQVHGILEWENKIYSLIGPIVREFKPDILPFVPKSAFNGMAKDLESLTQTLGSINVGIQEKNIYIKDFVFLDSRGNYKLAANLLLDQGVNLEIYLHNFKNRVFVIPPTLDQEILEAANALMTLSQGPVFNPIKQEPIDHEE
jgi:hypothetical protein